MKNKPELDALGGFEKSIDIPTWLGVVFLAGALLLASIPA